MFARNHQALGWLALFALISGPAFAQDSKPAEPTTNGPAPGHSIHGEVFDEGSYNFV